MKLTFLGAAGEVTGSCTLVQSGHANLLVDCGMFQGSRTVEEKNIVPPELSVSSLTAVLITHAHLDHIGRLPLLVRAGYKGPIYITPASADIAGIILRDAAKIQSYDNERLNRKRQRAGLPPEPPLFSLQDVEQILGQLVHVNYNSPIVLGEGCTAEFVEAGHLLGSASIRLEVDGRGVVFSGDVGPTGAPILQDAAGFTTADAVVMESTYGDRDHRSLAETVAEFEEIVRETVASKGKLLVPTFAVGRAQLLLFLLAKMFRSGRVEKFPLYLDSPMAIEATAVYGRHRELYDEEMITLLEDHPLTEDLSSLTFCQTAAESMALNHVPGPCLIMAGAGMCNAGRILHHLKQNLWRPEATVLIVGYQAQGSLGRLLVDGAEMVKIHGDAVAVRARVRTLGGFSAHAGQTDLLAWLEKMSAGMPRVFLNHGETRGREALKQLIHAKHGIDAELPEFGSSYEL